MLVHFRETPYGLAMSLVESRRENGKVRLALFLLLNALALTRRVIGVRGNFLAGASHAARTQELLIVLDIFYHRF
jgi:hypothetical protein